MKPQKASKKAPNQPKKPKPKRRSVKKSTSSAVLACASVSSCLTVIVLGIFILLGCVSPNYAVNELFLAKLHGNDTYDIQFRVGYFGGCVSVSNVTGGPSISTNTSLGNTQAHCVANMRAMGPDDLNEEFWEKMVLTNDTKTHVKTALNASLPLAKHLQGDVFQWPPPVLHFIFFFISAIILLVALASQSPKRPYKSILLTGTLLGAFALALALVMVVGSLQGLNALMNGDKSKMMQPIDGGLFFERGSALIYIQAAHFALVALFYIVMGMMYVRRSS